MAREEEGCRWLAQQEELAQQVAGRHHSPLWEA